MTDEIVSNTNSDITHVMENSFLRHVIYRTIQICNSSKTPEIDGFALVSHNKRKIMGNEFDGYYEGRLTTYKFVKYLD